jgi:hypothetical protein
MTLASVLLQPGSLQGTEVDASHEIILKLEINKLRTGYHQLKTVPSGGLFEHADELLSSITGELFLD